MAQDYSVLGKRLPRVDAFEKATGRAVYAADIYLPGMLYGKSLRSPYSHAKIVNLDTSRARKLPGVKAVLTYKDLASGQVLATNDMAHGMKLAQEFFASEKVRYQGQKIAAVAATDPDIAEDALDLIHVEFDELKPVFDPMEAIKPDAPLVHEEVEPIEGPDGRKLYNIAGETHYSAGDVDKAFSKADYVFEDTYTIPRVHHTYIEPNAVAADMDPTGKVNIWTCTQGIFSVRSSVTSSLNIPISKINVIGTTIGGGFGAKFGMLDHPYAVLLSQATGHPVKIVMSRYEEFLDGRPAPGCVITLKTAVKKDGMITARQASAYWDTGVAPGASIGQTGRIKGVYKILNIKYDAYAVYTNKPSPAAYRAPGAPQMTFASEAQLDRIACELDIDPVDLRLKNMLVEGDKLPEGGSAPVVGLRETLQAVAAKVDWPNRKKGEHEGWGVAVGEWTNGAGGTSACISLHEDGTAKVHHGTMDISGTDTALACIAAETLGVSYESVLMKRGDTDSVPFAIGSGGSAVTFSQGNAVKQAAEKVKARILRIASEILEASPEDLDIKDGKVFVLGSPDETITLQEVATASLHAHGGPIVESGVFSPHPSAPVISAQIAKIKIDPGTGRIKVLRFAGSLDVGTALNPPAIEGQMEGGAIQGLSWGIMEEMKYEGQTNSNPNLLDYQIPTALDLPMLESVIVEVPIENGPYGAKGVGEPPIAPTLATMANAVYDAIGIRINDIPVNLERIVTAIKNNGKNH